MLYHGSVANIQKFTHRDGVNNGQENYIATLATPDYGLAKLFALKVKEGYQESNPETAIGSTKDENGIDPHDFMITAHSLNGTPCAIIRDREKYLEAIAEIDKKGEGYLYTVPNETFDPVESSNGRDTHEWKSTAENLSPTSYERVTFNGAMRDGCQILFLKDGVTKDDLVARLKPLMEGNFDEGDKQIALYKTLVKEGWLIDENAARGIPNELNLSGKMQQQQAQQAQTQHLGYWSSQPQNQPNLRGNRIR